MLSCIFFVSQSAHGLLTLTNTAETLVYYNWQSPPHGWSCFESYKGKQYPVGAWNVPVDNVVCHAVKAGEDPNVPGSGDKPPVGRLASA